MGSSHLRINVNAKSIHDFISPDSSFLRDIVRNSYSRSRCYNLNSTLDLNVVLDILGEHAYTLKGDLSDDLLDIELLEEIAWHIGERYQQNLGITSKDKPTKKIYNNNVIDLPTQKILREN